MKTLTPLLQTRALSLRIGEKQICQNLNLSVQRGERWGVLGINGVGKTTLLHTLAGLRAPLAGEINLNGAPLTSLSRRQTALICGVMLQDSDDAFPASVLETALIGRHPHLKPWEWESAEDERLALVALEAVGLQTMTQRLTHTLSGGERRRLALASLLTQDSPLMLLDEPVNHLDMRHQIAMLDLLTQQVAAHHKSWVMVLHDVNLAARYCDHLLLLLGEGEILQGAVEEVLNESNLVRLYQCPVSTGEMHGRKFFFPA